MSRAAKKTIEAESFELMAYLGNARWPGTVPLFSEAFLEFKIFARVDGTAFVFLFPLINYQIKQCFNLWNVFSRGNETIQRIISTVFYFSYLGLQKYELSGGDHFRNLSQMSANRSLNLLSVIWYFGQLPWWFLSCWLFSSLIIYDSDIVMAATRIGISIGHFCLLNVTFYRINQFRPFTFLLLTSFMKLERLCVTEEHHTLALHSKTSIHSLV